MYRLTGKHLGQVCQAELVNSTLKDYPFESCSTLLVTWYCALHKIDSLHTGAQVLCQQKGWNSGKVGGSARRVLCTLLLEAKGLPLAPGRPILVLAAWTGVENATFTLWGLMLAGKTAWVLKGQLPIDKLRWLCTWGLLAFAAKGPSLPSLAHFCKKAKGLSLVNCVHVAMFCRTVLCAISCYSILTHDTLHHHLCSDSSLENGERELGHFSRCCRSCKNTDYTSQGACLHHKRLLKSGNLLRHQLIDMAYILSSPDPSLFLQKWVWLMRLKTETVEAAQEWSGS